MRDTSAHSDENGGIPGLSVIVPVHRTGAPFERCLDALSRSLGACDEVIVVADGGDGGALVAASARGFRASALPLRSGPAVARNAGAALARNDVLLFIDADVEVHGDTLEQVRRAFSVDPSLDALIGSYDDDPAADSTLSRYRNLLHHFTHQGASDEATTFWGACGGIRRDVFEEVGGFDESYGRPSVEDIALGYRLLRSGKRIVLRKDVLVKHLKHWNLLDTLRTDVLLRAAPWTRLLLEHRILPADLNLRWEHRASVLVAYGMLLVLATGVWQPLVLALLPLLAVWLLVLNLSFYRLLRRKLGISGSVRSYFWHWLFYLCAGAGAAVGAVQYLTLRPKGTPVAGKRRASVPLSTSQ